MRNFNANNISLNSLRILETTPDQTTKQAPPDVNFGFIATLSDKFFFLNVVTMTKNSRLMINFVCLMFFKDCNIKVLTPS